MARRKWGQAQYVEDGIYAMCFGGNKFGPTSVHFNFRDEDTYRRVCDLVGAKSWPVDGIAVRNHEALEMASGSLDKLPPDAVKEFHLENWANQRCRYMGCPILFVLSLLKPGSYERTFEVLEYDFK